MQPFVLRFLVILLAILFYYGLVVGRLGPLSRPLSDWLGVGRRYPLRDISAVINLPLAAMAQLLFCFLLIAITGVEIGQILLGEFRPILLLYGVLLGIGDMALATFFCNVGIQVATKLAPAGGAGAADWHVVARGGWMRYHMKTIEVAPLWLAALSILLYVSVEEVIFRGILIESFLPAGGAFALAASVLLFVLVQIFHMPDWRAAMFPVIGSLVIGILHGSLYLAVPTTIPLIIAHFVFFVAAVI